MKIEQYSFNNILKNNFFFEKKPKIAVAVSGGPDSIALVFLLSKWIKKNKGQLIALIVNHQIRIESKTESKKIKNYLISKNIKSKIININKKNVLKKTMSEARNNRFFKMLDYCKKNKIFHLFFGHHYNDNLETFMLRKIAGSNFDGLRSIQKKSIINKIQILRPLLSYNKKNILNYNKTNELFYLQDPSNFNSNYSRVIVRNFLSNYNNTSVQNDFNLIQRYHPHYRKMIFQIFHKINTFNSKNQIIVNNIIFEKINLEIQIKIIEIIYEFLKPKRIKLRYSKVFNALKNIKKKTTNCENIAGLKINKSNSSLVFIA